MDKNSRGKFEDMFLIIIASNRTFLKNIRDHENRFPNNEFMKNAIKFILPQNLGWRLGSDSYF